jgi:membrane-associated phospholipid phosphatase
MKIISSIGTEYFYMAVVMFAFWCLNEKAGFRLGLLVLVSAWANNVLKIIVDLPRPYEFYPLLGLVSEPTRAFPSGHAQNSMTFWISAAFCITSGIYGKGSLFSKIKTIGPCVWIFSCLMILLIGFSRIYLGVHYPTDVLGGWVFAFAVLLIFYFLEKPVSSILYKAPVTGSGEESAPVYFSGKRLQLICAAASALIMTVLLPQDNSLAAMLLGFCAGYSLMINNFPFVARNKVRFPQLCLRFAIGITGFGIIYLGLSYILPGNNSIFKDAAFLEPYYELARFIRYSLLGLWASAGAPRLFLKFGLAAAPDSKAPRPADNPS